jgi:mannosidase alpha-like ER degradation enhancer 1
MRLSKSSPRSIVGHYHVRSGHTVYINDSTIFAGSPSENLDSVTAVGDRDVEIQLLISLDLIDPMFRVMPGNTDASNLNVQLTAYAASFGADLSVQAAERDRPARMAQGKHPISVELNNKKGCSHYKQAYEDGILVVERGGCTFLEKLLVARDAGALGVIVLSDEDSVIIPSAGLDEIEESGDISDAGLLLLPKTASTVLAELMDLMGRLGGRAMVAIQRESIMMADSSGKKATPTSSTSKADEKGEEKKEDIDDNSNPRILYINGHALLNTRLLV